MWLQCRRCGNIFYGSYCTNCGAQASIFAHPYHRYQPYPYTHPPARERGAGTHKIITRSWMVFMTIFFFAFFAYIALLWVGTTLVVPSILENTCAECQAILLVITPQPVPVLIFEGVPFVIYYLFVVVIISSCFFWLIVKDVPRVIASFSESLRGVRPLSRTKSSWVTMARLFSLAIFFSVSYNFILILLFGTDFMPSHSEIGPFWYYLYAVANAAFWEEIVSRTLLIGIPLFVVTLVRKRRVEKPLRYLTGGGFEIGVVETILLIFSAFMFGAAHTYGSGVWVFPPLFVGGLVLGYLFLRKGIVTSILFHFAWNYSITFNYMASITGNSLLLAVGLAYNLFLAFVGFLITFQYLARFVLRTRIGERAQTGEEVLTNAESYQSTVPSPPQRTERYQCPHCGGVVAIYKEGHFQCLRCGHIT